MDDEPIDPKVSIINTMRKCGLPKQYLKEGVSLSSTRDPLGKKLFDLTAPDNMEYEILLKEKSFWLFHHDDTSNMREIWFLMARSLILDEQDTYVISYVELQKLLAGCEDRDDIDRLDICKLCDFLFIDEFHDVSIPRSGSAGFSDMMWFMRKRVEEGKSIFTYADKPLDKCLDWPYGFRQFLKYNSYELRGQLPGSW